MKIRPNAGDWALASSIHAEFWGKPESHFIATNYALAHLSALITQTRPHRVLEIGAGIGTVTRLLLDHPANIRFLASTEAQEVCRRELAANIEANDTWHLCYEVEDAAADGPFDLVVLHGVIGPAQCSLFSNEAVFFVEGKRRPERQAMERFFAKIGKSVTFEQYSPSWQLRRKPRRIWGFLPKFELQRRKGCYIGRLAAYPADDIPVGHGQRHTARAGGLVIDEECLTACDIAGRRIPKPKIATSMIEPSPAGKNPLCRLIDAEYSKYYDKHVKNGERCAGHDLSKPYFPLQRPVTRISECLSSDFWFSANTASSNMRSWFFSLSCFSS